MSLIQPVLENLSLIQPALLENAVSFIANTVENIFVCLENKNVFFSERAMVGTM